MGDKTPPQFTISIDNLLAECNRLLDFKAHACRSSISAGISESLEDLAAADYNAYAACMVDMVTVLSEPNTATAVQTMARAKALEYNLISSRNSNRRDS